MKAIAYWSRDHIPAARILIGVCHIIILCLAWYIGLGLMDNHVFISPLIFYASISLFLVINLFFKRSYHLLSFNKRKVLDVIVMLCSFMAFISFFNQKNIGQVTIYNSLSGSFTKQKNKEVKNTGRPSYKELRKQFKAVRTLAKSGPASGGGIALAVLVGILLGIIVSIGACSLACNGNGTLALLLLGSGLVGIFFICKAVIEATEKKKPKPTVRETQANTNLINKNSIAVL